ncbi:MAG TPA: tetratricopeptide repeat protein [Gemmatimonadaceae bacterium]
MSRRLLKFALASAALMLGAAAAKHFRRDTVIATPLIAMPATPYDESTVRDRDIEFYSRRLAEDPASAADRVTLAKLFFTRSRITGSEADLTRAEELARESIAERAQRNYQAFELLASILMARHEFREARKIAAQVDSIDPGSHSHLALLGEIELELGDYDAAARHFGAIQYDGRNFTTGARLARWYELTGRLGKARTFLKQSILKVDHRDDLPREQVAWFHYRLGDLELRAGNTGAADSAFNRGLTRNPGDPRALGGLARSAFARGDWQRAIEFGERATAAQLDPGTLGIVSASYYRIGNSEQAASYAKAMSASALEQPGPIHRAWGLFLLDHGSATDRARVLELARRELEDRKDVYGHDLLAWALYRNGQLAEARAEMKIALSQRTEDVMLAGHARAIGVN